MVIYQPADLQPAQTDLYRIADEARKHLLPAAKLLDSRVEARHVRFLIRSPSLLTSFELYSGNLDLAAFQDVLKVASELESRRKQWNDPNVSEINLYLLAHHVTEDFVQRLSLALIGIRLFEWSLLHSKDGDALLISERKYQALQNGPETDFSGKKPEVKQRELSTRELIAFARFGMELRDRRLRLSRLF